MTLRLFDTYARQERPFTPLAPPQVRLYACGPTVYNYQHIGNLRTYIFEDILRRASNTAAMRSTTSSTSPMWGT